MPLQNFIDNNLPTIKAAWLNAIDVLHVTVFDSAATKAQARTAIDVPSNAEAVLDADLGTGVATALALPITAFASTVLDDATSNLALTTLTTTRSETGATAVSVLNKLREILSVKDFGATGDGTTNDTTAIQSAIDALPANGGAIYFPPGNYSVGHLTWTKSGVKLYGDGEGGSRLTLRNTTNNSMFKVGDGGVTAVADTVFCGLNLIGNSANQTVGHGIHSYTTRSLKAINCTVRDFKENGIRGEGTASGNDYYGHIEGCYVVDNDGDGIRFQGQCYSYSVLTNVIAGNGKLPAGGAALYAASNDTHRIVGNLFDENENGILFSGVSDVVITGNQFENQDRSSIAITASSARNVVTGNSILNSGLETTNTFYGVVLTDSNYNVVAGNMIVNSSATAMSDGVRETGTSNYNAVTGNTINNASFGVRLSGANSRKSGNTGLDTDFTAVRTSSTNGLGYITGAGGTVIQATSKTTAVTLNTPTGRIRTTADALAAGATVTFQLNNTAIETADVVVVGFGSNAASNESYNMWTGFTTTGQCVISLKNITAGSLSEAVDIRFVIIKGATA